MRIALLPVLLLAAAPAAPAQQSRAPFTVAETGQGFRKIDDAVGAIMGGQGTIVIAPGVYRQCLVQIAGDVTYQAAQPGTAVFDGETCEGKAAFVLRGRRSVVDGVVFRNMRVPDGNGAGIRIELGDLEVRNAMFLDSQEGILGGYDAAHTIAIDRSTFSGLGQCDETVDCSHSIYINEYGTVRVTRSRFERGTGGHYLKSRATRIEAVDNSFDDTAGRATNYLIDLPDGATGTISGNSFTQGRAKENHSALIAVAAEVRRNPVAGLSVTGNTARLAPGARPTVFVATGSREAIRLAGNDLGSGITPVERR